MSVKAHSREERNCSELLRTKEPLACFLKHTLTINSVSKQNSIQAGLCGVCLMLTVEQLYKVFTDSCDLITVQKHTGDLTFGNNLSVATLPIECFVDCFVHQGFDLAHGSDRGGVPLTLLIYTIQDAVLFYCDTSTTGTSYQQSVQITARSLY